MVRYDYIAISLQLRRERKYPMVGSLDGRLINVSDGLDALLYLSCTKAVTLEVFPIHKIDRYPN